QDHRANRYVLRAGYSQNRAAHRVPDCRESVDPKSGQQILNKSNVIIESRIFERLIRRSIARKVGRKNAVRKRRRSQELLPYKSTRCKSVKQKKRLARWIARPFQIVCPDTKKVRFFAFDFHSAADEPASVLNLL